MKRALKDLLLMLLCTTLAAVARAQSGGELRFCLHTEPKTFNPLLVEDDASDTVRYLTTGVLLRLNRSTQQLEPELATKWSVSKDGRRIRFTLREGVQYSDGTPFSADDVVATLKQLADPDLHSPFADTFRSGQQNIQISKIGRNGIEAAFPQPVVGLDKIFDQLSIVSSHSPLKEKAALGPFVVADYVAGSHVILRRNPRYWKKDAAGRQLPYLDSIRLDVQQNRDLEAMRFRRGEIDLINSIDSEYFDRLSAEMPQTVHDSGPGFDSEEMWFNQVADAPIEAYKRAWFRSTNFRRAISMAINRQDIVRLVYRDHAAPAAGPVSPANHFWYNAKLPAPAFDSAAALKLLAADGFTSQNGVLRDHEGHAVEFALITNSGNKQRERIATLIQQDLGGIGIKVNIITLDFQSLIERITRTFKYEACLLGLINDDLDPNSQMNVWLSSAENHQWNPRQSSPATPWEAEIDKLMKAQASELNPKLRKRIFDRVQEIAAEQQPMIYLVYKNALSAIRPSIANATPVVLRPQTYWNAERLAVRVERAAK